MYEYILKINKETTEYEMTVIDFINVGHALTDLRSDKHSFS